MTSYYIDPVDGSDSAAGTSEGAPWKTWGKITSASAWLDGDSYLGKRGTTARESVTPGDDGVTIGVYGSGSSTHILSGADIAANGSWAKTGGRTNVYEFTYTTASGCDNMVWEDDARLAVASDVADCDATPGSWYYSAGTIYVHASDSSSAITNAKVYEVPGRPACIDNNGADDCVYAAGLECVKGFSDDTNYGNIKLSGENNIMRGMVSHNGRRHSLQLLDNAAYKCKDNLVFGGEFYNCDGSPISVFSVGGGLGTSGNIIENALAYQAVAAAISNSGCCTVHGNVGGPVKTTFKNCKFYSSSNSTRLLYFFDCVDLKLIGCYLHDFGADFLEVTGTTPGFEMIACRVDATDGNPNNAIIYLLGAGVDDARLSQNVFYGAVTDGSSMIRLLTGVTGVKIYNNIFEGVAANLIKVGTGCDTGFECDFNYFYDSGSATPFEWLGTDYNFADWKTNSSQDANSVTTDPALDADYNMPAHVKGARWWSGANPIGNDGEPFADWDPSIGRKQFQTIPFHPVNL